MLESAEGGLPAVETVIEGLHAGQLGVQLEGLADFEHAVHAGGVPGGPEQFEGLLGVGAGSFGVVLCGFDGGQVAGMTLRPRLPATDGSLSAASRVSLAWGRCPALSWVLPLNAASRAGENQVNQSGDACWLSVARVSSAWPIRRRASRVCPLMVSHSASTASSQARNSAEAAPSGTWRARERR